MSKLQDRLFVACGMLRIVLSLELVFAATYVIINLGSRVLFGQRLSIEALLEATKSVSAGLWKPATVALVAVIGWCLLGPFEMSHEDSKSMFRSPFRQIIHDIRKGIKGKKMGRDS